MTWFKVDDSFYRSRKVRKLGGDRVPAVGLWTLCGGWAADNLSDGFVPWEIVEGWDEDRSWSKRLITAGLWVETELDGEPGVSFHDWADWQPTSDQVKQRRKADAERRARWREAQKQREKDAASHRDSQSDASQCDPARDATVHLLRDADDHVSDMALFESDASESRRDASVQSRTSSHVPEVGSGRVGSGSSSTGDVQEQKREKPRARKTAEHPIPDTWRPNDNHIRQAGELGLDVAEQARLFRNHADMHDRRLVRWDAGFRQWLEHAPKFAPKSQSGRQGGDRHQPYKNPDPSEYLAPDAWGTP